MTHPDILAALMHERVNTFLGEAQAARQASLARAARPPVRGKRVVLRDGSMVLIRPVRSGDAPLLTDGFARLSPHSRWMRFLGTKTSLSAAELRYFTGPGHHDHEAIGALSAADGRGVGIALYVRDTSDPRSAEIAVTIAGGWQGRGLGTELLARLSDRARQAGIYRFTAVVGAENAAMARLLRNMGACLTGRSPGTVEYEVALVTPARDPGYDQAHQPVTQPC
jgi:RimJ/RimL family protein N-acetyltransferase